MPNDTALSKNYFFICEQLEIVSGLDMLSLSLLGLYLAQACVDTMHAVTVFQFICALFLLCLEGLASLVSFSPSGSYNFSVPSSARFPEPYKMELMETSH